MNINLLAEGLDGSLAEIVAKLQSLIDSFWIYIVIALISSSLSRRSSLYGVRISALKLPSRIATKRRSTPAT